MDWDKLTDKLGIFGERTGRTLKRVFGSANERAVRKLEPLVGEINALEPWAQALSEEDVRAEIAAVRKAVADEELELDAALPKVFALVREASVRTLGLRHYDVQLVGGIVLHQGSIAEMKTGEGKTLVATLPLVLNALSGKTSFLVTVNDYLAKRDAAWMGPIFTYLGLSWGSIQSTMEPNSRHSVYDCDIVYATNNELGFDYLRDNMKTRLEDQVQRDLNFAIVDEVDSILIDEARTPLIISGPAELMPQKYAQADAVARALEAEVHYEVKEKERQVSLLEDGIAEAERILGVESFYAGEDLDWPHYIENALRAHTLYENDKEYVVEEGEVVIVDEFTGRKMTGRRWSDGLHQAVETKEGLSIRQENQTLATITFQNYFRLYSKLSGMTGTAVTEAEEFFRIYGMEVVSIPTNLPIARNDAPDVVFRTEPEKWKAIADELEETHTAGQPVLVGTTSIENSEKLAGILSKRGIPHNVLNAKNHEREAHIVARAGEKSAITVATNMAGRGTDIKLGGNFEYRLAQALEEAGLVQGDLEKLEEIDTIRERVRAECDHDEAEVLELGGLYVLGTERHEARRIDDQLRGRAGRQGDVGTSRFYLSLQDPLMRRFYRDWVTNFMERLGMTEGQAIESPMVTRAIQKAQKKVEEYHFEQRKNLLEYDEVMDEQRKTIYGVRQDALEGADLRERVEEMFASVIERSGNVYTEDPEGFRNWFQRTFGAEVSEEAAVAATAPRDLDPQGAIDEVLALYKAREDETGVEVMRQIERYLFLRTLDSRWKDHLHAIDSLKAGIGLRGYAQKDPKNEYKREGFELFERLIQAVEEEISSLVLRVQVAQPGEGQSLPQAPASADAAVITRGEALAKAAAFQEQQLEARAAAVTERLAAPGGTSTQARPAAQPRARSAGTAFDQARVNQEQQRRQQPGGATAAVKRPAPAEPKAEELAGAKKNDPCPCGSGLKFKKCHGRQK